MCLLSVAWQCNERFPFVFAGNRDEYHARPSAAAYWWRDAPGVLGGRDLVAGGSWLGISVSGRFSVVTNQPRLIAPKSAPLSRGTLVVDWLKGPVTYSADTLHSELAESAARFGGFNLLTATIRDLNAGTLHCFAGGNGSGELRCQLLSAGVIGLSNTDHSRPWPKSLWLNREMERLVREGTTGPEQLFDMLRREQPVPDTDAQGVSTRPFIKGQEYGTRCSTVITVDRDGQCRFIERRFGSNGIPAGESTFEFRLQDIR